MASNWGGIDRFAGDRFENLSQIPKSLALPIGEDRSGGLFILLDGQPFALRKEGDRVDTIPELYQERGLIGANSGDLWFAGSPAKSQLGRIRSLMDRVIDDARKSVQGLRSTGAGLSEDLEHAISLIPEELGGAKDTSFRVIVNGRPRPLRPVLRDEVYRICRESLLNAFRHSEAENIEVEIGYLGRELMVVVRHDGRGLEPAILHSGREGHWGLPGMRERAERIGARLTLRSRPGSGTEVELTLPARIAFSGHAPSSVRRVLRDIFLGRRQDPGGTES